MVVPCYASMTKFFLNPAIFATAAGKGGFVFSDIAQSDGPRSVCRQIRASYRQSILYSKS
jgi:hypothetical protein